MVNRIQVAENGIKWWKLNLFKRDLLSKPRCRIACECGGKYTRETSRPLGTRLREHEYNLRQGNVEKSKLAAHAIEEGHRIDGNPPRQTDRQTDRRTNWTWQHLQEIQRNSICASRQPSTDILSIWFPVIKKKT